MSKKIFYLFLGLVVGYIGYEVWEHIRTQITSGRLSLTALAISRTFSEEKWKAGYDAVQAVFDEFPRLKKHENRLIDGWNNDISITITDHAGKIVIDVRSAGHDQQFGTSDDQGRIVTFSKTSKDVQ